jgi:hypothetical protein
MGDNVGHGYIAIVFTFAFGVWHCAAVVAWLICQRAIFNFLRALLTSPPKSNLQSVPKLFPAVQVTD